MRWATSRSTSGTDALTRRLSREYELAHRAEHARAHRHQHRRDHLQCKRTEHGNREQRSKRRHDVRLRDEDRVEHRDADDVTHPEQAQRLNPEHWVVCRNNGTADRCDRSHQRPQRDRHGEQYAGAAVVEDRVRTRNERFEPRAPIARDLDAVPDDRRDDRHEREHVAAQRIDQILLDVAEIGRVEVLTAAAEVDDDVKVVRGLESARDTPRRKAAHAPCAARNPAQHGRERRKGNEDEDRLAREQVAGDLANRRRVFLQRELTYRLQPSPPAVTRLAGSPRHNVRWRYFVTRFRRREWRGDRMAVSAMLSRAFKRELQARRAQLTLTSGAHGTCWRAMFAARGPRHESDVLYVGLSIRSIPARLNTMRQRLRREGSPGSRQQLQLLGSIPGRRAHESFDLRALRNDPRTHLDALIANLDVDRGADGQPLRDALASPKQ